MEYKLISGVWSNRTKTKAVVRVEEKDGEGKKEYDYGLDRSDNSFLNALLWEQIDSEEAALDENIDFDRIDGKAPLEPGTAIVGGYIINVAHEKNSVRRKIRNRINELCSGYEIALSERDEVYARNRKRKIDNLLAAEADPEINNTISNMEDGLA